MSNTVSVGVKIGRGILFVLSRAAIVAAIAAIIVIAYQTAVNTSTVTMIIKDAFAKRAQVVLMPASSEADQEALEKLFTASGIESDEVLQSRAYDNADFTITSYYERADVTFQPIWPWENEATVKVTDIVSDIRATSNIVPDATGRRPAPDVPEWPTGIYSVHVVRAGNTGSWIIDDVKFEERVFPEDKVFATSEPTRRSPSQVAAELRASEEAAAAAGAQGEASGEAAPAPSAT